MSILTVNVLGIPSGENRDLLTANVFQDYSAVIVNPEDLERLYGSVDYRDRDENIVNPKYGRIIAQINERRRNEVLSLLRRGGVVVCFLQPLRSLTYEIHYQNRDRKYFITNYDWLFEHSERVNQLGDINYSNGKSIEFIDPSHPFAEYLETKPSWLAYVSKDDCPNWKMLATAFDNYALSLTKRVELGHIVFIPSSYDYRNGEVLEKCIVKLMEGKEFLPQPDWAKEILVPGQDRLASKIDKLNKQISTLENDRENLITENNELERWKYLVYEKGKHQLEPIVREVFSLIGCNVTPQADKDSDGIIVCDDNIALLEITGSKGTIRIQKLGELTTNMGNYMARKGKKVKGILVGNPFCENQLDDRPPKNSQRSLFAKELIESAEEQGITILTTTDLYNVVSQILSNDMVAEDKAVIVNRIFEGRGLTILSSS